MSNVVLKSFSVENFGPFAEKIYFTTAMDKAKKEFTNNTFYIEDKGYCKTSYIFGGNGSGKTNFCRAIDELKRIIIASPFLADEKVRSFVNPADLMFKQEYFKFNKKYYDKETKFLIEMIIDEISYEYTFSIKKDKVVYECLNKKWRRTENLILRESPSYNDIEVKSDLAIFKNNISVVKDNVLCLAMAAFLNVPVAGAIVDAISSIAVYNMASFTGFNTLTEEVCTPEKMKKYVQVLKFADKTLENINVRFDEQKTEKQKPIASDFEGRELVIRQVKVDVTSQHRVYNDASDYETIDLPFLRMESNGTIKLFGVAPLIFSTLERGGVLMIDEIENGLHSDIVKQIVKLFMNPETNPNNAQLICTTLSTEIFKKETRRDQIWVMAKDKCGLSKLSRISDMDGIRYNDNPDKYIETDWGGIPEEVFKN